MPIYEYIAVQDDESCAYCKSGFEVLGALDDERLTQCPQCRHPVKRQISAAAVGRSQTGMDDRAKNAGFHKLKKVSHGEYEKQY